MKVKKIAAFTLFMALAGGFASAQTDPVLLMTKADAANIKAHLKEYKVLGKSYEKLKKTADYALSHPTDVPIPKDNGGGYTHEKHKQNYRDMYAAGVVYRVTGDKAYAKFVEKMLLEYAKMYPTLPLHPLRKNDDGGGKLFWQSLNDYVWVVNSIQAYDMVRDNISPENREIIERDVFRSMSDFISKSKGKKEIFNWIHNHATWADAAVGMTGYVLKDRDMVDRALYGSDKDGKTGFLKQIDELFSPDGYYSEGPYYQRYAFQPFMLFAQAIQNNQPDLKIFQYKNGVLGKAARTIFQLTDTEGRLLPINDAIKGKDYTTNELVIAADVAYNNYHDKSLLPVIKAQGEVEVCGAGFEAAKGLQDLDPDAKYAKESAVIADGPQGQSGGLAVLRTTAGKKKDPMSLVYKYTTQGMGHGHFDRLSIMFYNGDDEILEDYGAARYVNVEARNGGRYLKENDSYAQQTIAHNTVIVDETSDYKADWKKAQEHSPEYVFSDISKPDEVQIISAKEDNAYPGVAMQRTTALVGGDRPFIFDVFRLSSAEKHQYDLNFMYNGQIMETGFKYGPSLTSLNTLGTDYGYEHVWKLAEGTGNNGITNFTWLKEHKFYTISTITDENTRLLLTQVGANDPDFNLRHETGYMVRVKDKDNYTFVSVIEPHGYFGDKMELSQDSHPAVKNIAILYQDDDYTAVKAEFKDGTSYTLLFANKKEGGEGSHKVTIAGKEYKWKGNYTLIKK